MPQPYNQRETQEAEGSGIWAAAHRYPGVLCVFRNKEMKIDLFYDHCLWRFCLTIKHAGKPIFATWCEFKKSIWYGNKQRV